MLVVLQLVLLNRLDQQTVFLQKGFRWLTSGQKGESCLKKFLWLLKSLTKA